MARARASHAVWRELIAARLDRPLTRAETRALAAHLHECAGCRQVDHDYRQERDLLRALPQPPAPRDLWPRTSAALDREVARGAYRGRFWRGVSADPKLPGVSRRPSAPSAALITTLAAMGVIAALGVMQLLPTFSVAPPTARSRATPFAVAPQPLAFIGNEAADLYVYQTHVGHVCPQSAPDCEVDDRIMRTPVDLPASVHARNVALSPTGRALALVGRDMNRDMIAVVLLPNASDGGTPDMPDGSQGPDTTPARGSDGPSSNAASPVGSATLLSPSDTPPDGQSTTEPDSTASTPPASPVPGLRVLAILENVQSAGAAPAWSPSGATLAFSAMPADGSHGPDVYVWSPSDAVARPITTDHGSYFASWSGERIVFSRINAKADAGAERLSTVVIDPLTLEERTVAGPALWLPVVNPSGTHAIAWRGELDVASGLAVPQTGTLYMIRWDVLDPFAAGNEPLPTETPTDQPSDTPSASGSPAAAPTDTPAASPTSSATAAATSSPTAAATQIVAAAATPSATAAATPSATAATETPTLASPTATDATASATPTATEQATPPLPAGSVELDLGRDTSSAPVVDWQVRWSVDGQVLGIWIADAQGSSWGRLTVLAVDPDTHQVGNSEPLLSPTLARRGFSLGMSRVAWVAPSEDNPDGELRIHTWGDDGVGGLRLLPSKLEEVLPAF